MIEKFSTIKDFRKKLEMIEQDVKALREKQEHDFTTLMVNLTDIKKSLTDLNESKKGYMQQMKYDLDSVKNIEKEFSALIRSFKQNHKQMYEYAYKQLSTEMKLQMSPLKKIVEELNKLKPLVEGLSNSFNNVKIEIEKLIKISGLIKKEDFELKNYAKELLRMDSEKLRLMKQIETLKRVIAHERRFKR